MGSSSDWTASIAERRTRCGASGQKAANTSLYTASVPDAPHRVLRSAIDAVQSLDDPIVGTMQIGGHQADVPRAAGAAPVATATGHIDAMALFAGEGVGSITELRPAGTIVRELAAGARSLLAAGSREPLSADTR